MATILSAATTTMGGCRPPPRSNTLLHQQSRRAATSVVLFAARRYGRPRGLGRLITDPQSDKRADTTKAFPEKTESRDSPAGTNRIQGSCWNGGQHGWRNRIRKICVRASLERDRMALLFRRLRSNLE